MKILQHFVLGFMAAVIAPSVAAQANLPAADHLVGYWPANEGSGEVVANVSARGVELDGTLNNGSWSGDGGGHTGKAGDFAFELNGEADSHVEVPQTDVVFEEITIAAWVKGVPAGDWTGIVYARSAQAIGLDFHAGTGNLTYTWNDNSNETWGFNSELHVPENEWTFVAMSLKADGNTLYVGTTGDTPELMSNTNEIDHIAQTNDQSPFLFGVDACCGDGRNFEGLMDEVAIWDVALSPEEIEKVWIGDDSDPNVNVKSKLEFQLPFVTGKQELTVTIQNGGVTQDLALKAALTEGEHFSLISPADGNLTVAPSDTGEIKLEFDPRGQEGQFNATLRLETNDPDEDDRVIDIELVALLRDPSGPVGLYPLDDPADTRDIIDASGSGRPGVYEASTGSVVFEKDPLAGGGSAVQFSGGAHVSVQGGLNGLESFSTALWMNAEAAEFSVVFANGSEATPGVAVLNASGDLQWFFDSEPLLTTMGAPMRPNVTHHVVITFDAPTASVQFFIDGAIVNTQPVAGGPAAAVQTVDPLDLSDPRNQLTFGGITSNPSLGINGVLDDIRLFDRALTAMDVQCLFDSQAEGCDGPMEGPDSDGDGLADAREIELGTDPFDADTDDDGLTDGDEQNTYKTDATKLDTDGDTLSDGTEVARGSDPLDGDDPEEILATAYIVPEGTSGNQDFGGSLGHDFIVRTPIVVNELGVFDDDSDGLVSELTVVLWTRDDGGTPEDAADDAQGEAIATLVFTPEDSGVLINGSRFKPLTEPLRLEAGGYTIVAFGYGAGERNGNQGSQDLGTSTESGGAALQFVGGGRWGADPGAWPDNVDGGPADRYAAGTFTFSVERKPVDLDFQIVSIGRIDTNTMIAWQSASGKDYVVEFSEGLSDGWVTLTEVVITGTGELLSYETSSESDSGYFRVRSMD